MSRLGTSQCRYALSILVLTWMASACGDAAQQLPTVRSIAVPCPADTATATPIARSNDQTEAAGVMFTDTLDLQFDIRRATLLPEGERGPRLDVVTFGVAGAEPVVPGPLVRVSAGTTVLARVCNTLPDTVWLVGLANRGDTVVAPPGATAESAFTLDSPGVRVYRGVTREDTVLRSFGPSATLGGTIVTDGADRWGDRVLVITDWAPSSSSDRFALDRKSVV